MKVSHLPYFLILLLTMACNSPRSNHDDIVDEVYFHRYGVALDPADWSNRGQHGKVVTTMADGTVVTRTYESGVLNGEATYTFPHQDIIQKKELYDRDSLVKEMYYYHNGIAQQQVIYHDPARRTVLAWYESGIPRCKEEYENGLLVQGEYFDSSNQVISGVNHGKGTRTFMSEYGQLLSTDDIDNGQIVLHTTYHPNRSPDSVMPYVNGVPQGIRHTFLPGGEPYTTEEWASGYQHGQTIVFQNGERYATVPYQNGKKNGVEQRYREDAVVEEIAWMQDQRHGPSYSYVGDNKKTYWYVQGKLANKATYDAFQNQ